MPSHCQCHSLLRDIFHKHIKFQQHDSGSVRWGCDVLVPLLGMRLLEVLQWHCSCAALIVGGSALGVGSVLWPSGNSLVNLWPLKCSLGLAVTLTALRGP